MTTDFAPEWQPVDDDLARVAGELGVATEYWDQGGQLVQVGAATVRAVLAALGVDSSSPEAIARALEERRLASWRRMLPPAFIGRQGQDRRLWVHLQHGEPVVAWVELEDGGRRDLAQLDWWVEPVDVDGVLVGEASFTVPGDLPCGYHVVHAVSGSDEAATSLIMAPDRLMTDTRIGDRQWGLMAQLYATRSRTSWGLGDLADLRQMCEWGGRAGAGFVLINPLHAASPGAPMAPSPYLPVTRRFANPMYLRIEDIPEYSDLPSAVRERIDQLGGQLRLLNDRDELLDRDAVWAAKRAALEVIFKSGRSSEREREFRAFVDEQGQGLLDFAIWCAIVDDRGSGVGWPAELGHPRSADVFDFHAAHQGEVDFHMWLQWLVDQQLEQVQAAATAAGMAIGVMHDLAVGVHPEGADAWALQDVLAGGVGVGAPPDMYNQLGQNWHQPPWRPEALAEAVFAPYRDMLRTVLHHAGGMRIDHVLGLFRMWWVPAGFPAHAGTFVRFDHDAMLGILTLEAQRSGAVIVGEDLGTVEPWVQEELLDRGILGTSILWFESWAGGAVKEPADWRREVLASVTVHDLPPTAGYLRDEHVRIRSELGLLAVPEEQEREHAARERQAWEQVLRAQGWLAPKADLSTDAGLDDFAVALHQAAVSSPARLIGVAVTDLVGDRRAQNQPGTDQEYPNWRVPMADGTGSVVLLEEALEHGQLVDRVLDLLR